MKTIARLAFLTACLPFGTAGAADFDGSKPLICAPIEVKDCVSGAECASGRPVDAGLPAFYRIDFAKKVVAGPHRTTPIQYIDKKGNQILLLGTELGYAWSIALNSADGTMAGTIMDHDGSYVLFGSCTPL